MGATQCQGPRAYSQLHPASDQRRDSLLLVSGGHVPRVINIRELQQAPPLPLPALTRLPVGSGRIEPVPLLVEAELDVAAPGQLVVLAIRAGGCSIEPVRSVQHSTRRPSTNPSTATIQQRRGLKLTLSRRNSR